MAQWKLLFVDDSDLDVMLAVRALRQAGHEISHARVDTAAGLERALVEQRWDALIADHQMPEFDALAALRALNRSGRDLPFIIVSGVIPDSVAIDAMREGARDFIGKDKLTRLAPAIERELADAQTRALLRQTQSSVDRLMHYDMLTGIANSDALINGLRSLAASAGGAQPFALVMVEIQRFRKIARGLGMVAANRLLRAAAMRLSGLFGSSATVARLGADRFALLLPQVRDADQVAAAFARIRGAFANALDVNGQLVHVACAAGAVLYPLHGTDSGELLQHAEAALDAAAGGAARNPVGLPAELMFVPGMGAGARYSLVLESALHRALAQREFDLHYQPQIAADGGRVVGVEALLRWRHPDFAHLSPADYVPVLEESGLMLAVGEWVIAEAARQWHAWRQAGLPPLRMGINLSAVQLQQPDFVASVERILAANAADPTCFEFELTESMAMGSEEETIATLARLKGLGVSLAIDDFGTGYSSFAYLHRFPIDRLKIDRSFVSGAEHGARIAAAIAGLGRSLGLAAIAEGVETAEHALRVREYGCAEAQGFLYARPMPAAALAAFMAEARGAA